MQSAAYSQRREQLRGPRAGFIEEVTFELAMKEKRDFQEVKEEKNMEAIGNSIWKRVQRVQGMRNSSM